MSVATRRRLGSSTQAADYVATALPAAAATATPATPLDLGPQGGRNQPFSILQISCPATPALVDAKVITFSVTDCATSGGSYTAVEGYGAMTITGVATSQGGPVSAWPLRIHDHVKRYVKVTAAVESGGGSNVAVSFVMEILRDFTG